MTCCPALKCIPPNNSLSYLSLPFPSPRLTTLALTNQGTSANSKYITVFHCELPWFFCVIFLFIHLCIVVTSHHICLWVQSLIVFSWYNHKHTDAHTYSHNWCNQVTLICDHKDAVDYTYNHNWCNQSIHICSHKDS